MSATVLQFPTPAPKDGGKARILRRHALKERLLAAQGQSLTMDHADPEDTSPSYIA